MPDLKIQFVNIKKIAKIEYWVFYRKAYIQECKKNFLKQM